MVGCEAVKVCGGTADESGSTLMLVEAANEARLAPVKKTGGMIGSSGPKVACGPDHSFTIGELMGMTAGTEGGEVGAGGGTESSVKATAAGGCGAASSPPSAASDILNEGSADRSDAGRASVAADASVGGASARGKVGIAVGIGSISMA